MVRKPLRSRPRKWSSAKITVSLHVSIFTTTARMLENLQQWFWLRTRGLIDSTCTMSSYIRGRRHGPEFDSRTRAAYLMDWRRWRDANPHSKISLTVKTLPSKDPQDQTTQTSQIVKHSKFLSNISTCLPNSPLNHHPKLRDLQQHRHRW